MPSPFWPDFQAADPQPAIAPDAPGRRLYELRPSSSSAMVTVRPLPEAAVVHLVRNPAVLPDPLSAWATPYAAMAREGHRAWPTLDDVTMAAWPLTGLSAAGRLACPDAAPAFGLANSPSSAPSESIQSLHPVWIGALAPILLSSCAVAATRGRR
jgi:hypothetical protein